MAISFERYIDITSGVAAGSQVPRRDFGARVFSTNELIPTGGIVTSTSLDGVAAYFGTDSDEYKRASFYFGFISKQFTAPQRIDFARWVDADIEPQIYGADLPSTLAELQAIADGSLSMTIGGQAENFTGINLTAAGDLDAVATLIETAVQTGTGTQYTLATVTYNAVDNRFEFNGGDLVDAVITIGTPGSGTDLAPVIGWGVGAILSNGSLLETPVDAVINAEGSNNNFGSFNFILTLTNDQIIAIATWNHAENVKYQYHVAVTEANAPVLQPLVINLSGIGLTLVGPAVEFHEMVPMVILGSTDFSKPNASQNYMYQKASITATVSNDTLADTLDALRTNYYGETQTAGQNRSFYQRGFLQGPSNAPIDMGIFANEQWFKDSIGAELLTLLESLGRISANPTGRSQVISSIQNVIDGTASGGTAIVNGTISVGRELSDVTRQQISALTGDPDVWLDVENRGYWLDVQIEESTSTPGEFIAEYTLIYARDTVVRKVEGAHILV